MTFEGTVDVSVGSDAVEFALTVENAGPGSQDVTFRSGKKADFAVLDGGREVWRWSQGRMFTQALQTETLDADETTTLTATWDDPEPGEYTVVATLESDPGLEVREEFSV